MNVINADVNDYPNLRRIINPQDGYSRTLFTFAGLVFPNVTNSELLVRSLLEGNIFLWQYAHLRVHSKAQEYRRYI